MAFDIAFDYRFASHGFFTDRVRDVLEAAADAWESVITEEFGDVPLGIRLSLTDPSQAPVERTVTLDRPIDDLRIFVGSQSPAFGETGDALARSGVRGKGQTADILKRRVASDFREAGPATDFEPFAGVLSIDPEHPWNRDLDAPGADEFDLYTVVLHEIGHVLGIGQAQVFADLGAGQSFRGANARSINDGAPIPLANDLAHPTESYRGGDPLMSPLLAKGTREEIDATDKAMLADIGYAVENFDPQGRMPPVATDGDEGRGDGQGRTIFGSRVADLLDGLGGADQLQGEQGADRLYGGSGDDVLFGGPGADYLFGGPGKDQLQGGAGPDLLHAGPDSAGTLFGGGANVDADPGADTFYVAPGDVARGDAAATVRIADFDPAAETILVDPAFGFDSPEAVLAETDKPFRNVTRLDLTLAGGANTRVDVRHESQTGTPLTADNIAIGRPDLPEGKAMNGAPLARPDHATLSGSGRVVDVLANDADPDGDALIPTVLHDPAGVEVQVVIDAGRTVLQVQREPAFDGSARVPYIASDGNGAVDRSVLTISGPDAETSAQPDPADAGPGERLSALYLGNLGRPPGPDERAYWTAEQQRAGTTADTGTAGMLTDAAAALHRSEGDGRAFGTVPSPAADDGDAGGAVTGAVDALFENLFNRPAAAWAEAQRSDLLQSRLEVGLPLGTPAQDAVAGATGTDASAFAAKLDTATAFAEHMDRARFEALDAPYEAARALINGVGADAASVANAVADIGDMALVGQPAAFAAQTGDTMG